MLCWRAFFVVLVIAIAAVASTAEAGCRPVLDCRVRPCQQVQECDSALDDSGTSLRGQRPGELQRPVSPGLTAPEALPLTPPRDAGFCRRVYACDAGRCAWEVVCP